MVGLSGENVERAGVSENYPTAPVKNKVEGHFSAKKVRRAGFERSTQTALCRVQK